MLFTKPPAEARGVRRGRHPSQGTQAAGRGIDLWSHGAGSRRDAQAPPEDAARRASETRVALLAGRPGEAPPFPGAAADRGERGPAPRRPHGRVHPAPRDPAGTDPPGDSRAGKSGRGGAPGTAPRQSGAPTRSPGDRAQSRSGGAPARCPEPERRPAAAQGAFRSARRRSRACLRARGASAPAAPGQSLSQTYLLTYLLILGLGGGKT